MSKLFLPRAAAVLAMPLALTACSAFDSSPVAVPTLSTAVAAPVREKAAFSMLDVEIPTGRVDIAKHLPGPVKVIEGQNGSSLTYYRMHDHMLMSTAGDRHARPALSLIKLYLAAYVLEHGTVEDQYEALEMITNSSDEFAGELYQRYPESIDAIAQQYQLESTRAADEWGYSVTSTFDVVKFIAALLESNPTHPILVAMSQADEVAADGYVQDYGTAKLSNVLGSKWGWSDSREMHSSVSFGKNFVVAAAVNGSAEDLTDFVKSQVTVKNLKAATQGLLTAQKRGRPVPTYVLKPSKTSSSKPTTTPSRRLG